eukprot:TRINITY_DN4578_c0_g1_i1.p1 TRINITY_DN4578_c0_g1~~TRINITY_DN4578_c0_g1_i1.p1  ORF type:complete len:447 (+),score=142.44 TRINITY_DN4578_c0_g1_i1:87-1427(+)
MMKSVKLRFGNQIRRFQIQLETESPLKELEKHCGRLLEVESEDLGFVFTNGKAITEKRLIASPETIHIIGFSISEELKAMGKTVKNSSGALEALFSMSLMSQHEDKPVSFDSVLVKPEVNHFEKFSFDDEKVEERDSCSLQELHEVVDECNATGDLNSQLQRFASDLDQLDFMCKEWTSTNEIPEIPNRFPELIALQNSRVETLREIRSTIEIGKESLMGWSELVQSSLSDMNDRIARKEEESRAVCSSANEGLMQTLEELERKSEKREITEKLHQCHAEFKTNMQIISTAFMKEIYRQKRQQELENSYSTAVASINANMEQEVKSIQSAVNSTLEHLKAEAELVMRKKDNLDKCQRFATAQAIKLENDMNDIHAIRSAQDHEFHSSTCSLMNRKMAETKRRELDMNTQLERMEQEHRPMNAITEVNREIKLFAIVVCVCIIDFGH